MGKVRTETVKRAAREMIEKYPKRFNSDFQSNKSRLTEILDIEAKKLRNRIAGYITRLKRIEERKTKVVEGPTVGEEGEHPSETPSS